MSNNSVTAIYKDKNGFMWFGSYDGLNRYDGYEFKIFRNNIDDSTSLANSYIYCLESDRKNNLWVGTANGASVYNHLSATFSQLFYRQSNGDKKKLSGKVTKISKINETEILLASQTKGLILYGTEDYVGKAIPLKIDGKENYNYDVTSFKQSEDCNFIWVGIYKYGLCKLNLKTQQLTLKYPLLKEIRSLELLDDNTLLLGANDGLFSLKLNKPNNLANVLKKPVIVNNLFKDSVGNIYITTDGCGIFKITKASGKVMPYNPSTDKTLLRSKSVWTIYEDNQHYLWIGTLRGGVSVVQKYPVYFQHVISKSNQADHAENFILSFCEDKKKLWIGTDGAGIRCWDRKGDCYTYYNTANSALSSDFITGIIKDADSTIWASAWAGGINHIDPNTKKVTAYSFLNTNSGQKEDNAWFVFRDQDNNIWSGAKTPGSLYRLNRSKDKFELFSPEIKDLLCFIQAKDGKFWAGNYSTLYSINPKTNFVKSYTIGYAIRCILEDKNNNLWIGTSEGGLLFFDKKNGNYKRFTIKDGLPANTILRLLEDTSGNLWMSTYSGLCRFNPKNTLIRNFTVADGLQSNQFSYNAALKLSTGEFIFGGINGFNIFYPSFIKDRPRTSELMVTDIIINNSPIEKNQNLIKASKQTVIKALMLPYEKTTLSVDFCIKNLVHSDDIQYAYYLDGWDHQWNFNGKNRRANYTRLHEGTYKLSAKTTDIYGHWSSPVQLLTITVLPPWYRTWWMYTLYVISSLILTYIFIRYRKRQERLKFAVKVAQIEKSKEKELAEKQLTMFTFITHELRTPLSLIINPLKKALLNQTETSNIENQPLGVAYKNAKRLLSLVDQLLLFRKAESDADELKISSVNLNALCSEIYNCFVQQAEMQNLNFQLNVPEHTVTIFADSEKLEIALFNLVSNAFKFTPSGGCVTITLATYNCDIILKVSDTGCGINADELPYIYNKFKQINTKTVTGKGFGIGLFIVKHFIDIHGAAINCESIQNTGTTFTISLTINTKQSELNQNEYVPLKISEFLEELMPEPSGYDIKEEINPLFPSISDIYTERKIILIVDDNQEMNQYLTQLFAYRYVIYNAYDGIEGLKIAQEIKPDIIISDISMEGMDGIELCKRIKGKVDLAHIPIILLTATTDTEVQLRGISEGADDYITKPFDADILDARIQTVLKGRSYLRRYFLDNITLTETNQKVPQEYKDFLERCINVIESNLENQNFTISNFAQEMRMSKTSLSTKIKGLSGQTLNVFIRTIKLRRAAVLMITENITVAQAGLEVGFEDKRYFRQQFTSVFGLTPSEYIKKYRKVFKNELNFSKK